MLSITNERVRAGAFAREVLEAGQRIGGARVASAGVNEKSTV